MAEQHAGVLAKAEAFWHTKQSAFQAAKLELSPLS